METTLHRQLKELYGGAPEQTEVVVDGYRVDAVADGRLVEIQHGSLAAIRTKVRALLARHELLVVKPLAARKFLVTRRRQGGRVHSARYSPRRADWLDLFDDLVHFVEIFPHPRLTLEAILTEQEEHRLPAPKRRWHSRGYRVEDRRLRNVTARRQMHTAADLAAMLPAGLAETFTTAEIAGAADLPRWLAQKIAYCLRKTGAAEVVGKRGNALIYRVRGDELTRHAAGAPAAASGPLRG